MARINFEIIEAGGPEVHGCASQELFELGLTYSTGRDVEQDLVDAHKWFNLAALKGNRDALQYRVEIAREMTEYQIADAQKRAREWLATN